MNVKQSKTLINHAIVQTNTANIRNKVVERKFPKPIILLLAVCCGLSVANVYYAQPLLDSLAESFNIQHSVVGGVITATQVGCALALFFVVPLGDSIRRKKLIQIQLSLLFAVLMLVAFSQNLTVLLIGMLGVGLLGTAMTQGLIAYAATLASTSERGYVVGIVQSGVVVGLLLARTLAGVITDLSGWRSVYILSAVFSILMLVLIWRILPEPKKNVINLSFFQLIKSMFSLLKNEKTLQLRGFLGLLMFAAFSIFWTALVLPLSVTPFEMSHTEIGAFGLIGVAGALAAVCVGGLTDKGYGQKATAVALALLVISWIPIAMMAYSIWALVLGIILLDLGGQAIHVINQSMILEIDPEAASRLIGCYMLFYSVGSGLGAIASTTTYASYGWVGVCLLGFVVSIAAFIFWIVSQPYSKAIKR